MNEAARKAFDELPDFAREAAEAALTLLQNDRPLQQGRFENLKGKKLEGVSEIRIPWNGDEYRTYQVAIFREVIYILDAGIKKSPRSGEIPKTQSERLRTRKDAALADYMKRNANLVNDEYEQRRRRRGETVPSTPKPGGRT